MDPFSQIFSYTIILLSFVVLIALFAFCAFIKNYVVLLFHSFFVVSIMIYVFIQLFFLIIFLIFIFWQFILKPFSYFISIYFIFYDTLRTVFQFANLIFIQTSNAFDNF